MRGNGFFGRRFQTSHIVNTKWHGFLLLFVFLQFSYSFASAAPADYELKAAYIARFTEFIEWPAATPTDPAPRDFLVCVYGEDDIEIPLVKLQSLIHVKGREVELRLRSSLSDVNDCEILYVPEQSNHVLEKVHRRVEDRPVLVINEVMESNWNGQLITLYRDGDRLRIAIFLDHAQRIGFKISSRLLKLTQVVE